MSPAKHALLGASDSASWLACPQYAAMKSLFSDAGEESAYARAGTLAHAIGEYKARSYFLEPVGKRTYNARLKKFRADPDYAADMEEATELYLDTLKELALTFKATPFIALEQRVDYSDYVADGFGTCDALMIGEGRIVVVDYKNGAGIPVTVEDNSQLKLYACGALQTFRPIYGDTIQTVQLVIVQPHAGGVKRWETTRDSVLQWAADVVLPAAKRAIAGEGDAVPGEHCRFCRGKAQCRARIGQMLDQGKYRNAVPAGAATADNTGALLLSDAEVGAALRDLEPLLTVYNSLKDYALAACLDGKIVPGYKAVLGRNSREWRDLDAAFAALRERGVADALMWERKPVSVAGLEKALGKKAFTDVAKDLVHVKPGKPALVSDDDPRPAFSPAEAAFRAIPAEDT